MLKIDHLKVSGKLYWRNGYASEAAKVIIEFGFRDLHLHRIFATCDSYNIGSAKVLEKIGMKREDHLREHKWQKGKWRDSFLYLIFEHENENDLYFGPAIIDLKCNCQ